MTKDDLNQILKRKGYSIEDNNKRVCSTKPEQPERMSLVSSVQRKAKISILPEKRIKILFRIYSVKPLDYDNYHTKCLQDLLVKSGMLPGDEWHTLTGQVISEKAYEKEQERTEVEIEEI